MKITLSFLVAFFVFLSGGNAIDAIEDPLAIPNNRFGVHILFREELDQAADLVNSNGGDWGYITIPIQAGDKDLVKWQKFMDNAKKLHVIPIIRLATENYYFDTKVWRKPIDADVLDFANFLNALDWPTLNRYIVVFNEPNRADEWGGEVNANEYAHILNYAVEIFKSKYSDFFIISAGLDNAAENIEGESQNQYSFMQEMESGVPKVFNQVDAIASHSYPNPGFKQPPWVLTRRSIASFIYEKRLADLLGNKDLPVFITETGWSKDEVAQAQIASYYQEAFKSVWSDNNIVAVTPFILSAGNGAFAQFSLTTENGDRSEDYKALRAILKIKGNPKLKEDVTKDFSSKNLFLPTRDFSNYKEPDNDSLVRNKEASATKLVKWILKI